MKYFVYILQSQVDKSIYKGITQNLQIRLKQHNQGKNSSTKSKRPWKLLYFEAFKTRIEARNREKYFKSGIGREKLKLLINN